MKSIILLSLCVCLCISCCNNNHENRELAQSSVSTDLRISVYPENKKQQVVFGGDCKLTVKQWSEGTTDVISKQLFGDINLDILRIPIFTRIAIEDPIYDQIGEIVKSVQNYNPDVQVFASVANGDGYEENNLHREAKFPDSWVGCCPEHVYKLDLKKYTAFLDAFMLRMKSIDIPIHYLGPFNEDRGFALEYNTIYQNMKELGQTKTVNLERYNVSTSVSDHAKLGEHTDIIGSHYFDDKDPAKGIMMWNQLVTEAQHPVWFTESTRFKNEDSNENLMNGLNHIFPSINAGVEAVIFYQVFPRFVEANGSAQPIKFTGFKTFINTFKNAHVIECSSTDDDVQCVANLKGDLITIHLLNYHASEKTALVHIANSNVLKANLVTWTDQSIMKATSLNNIDGDQLTITLPANSYVMIELEKSP